MRIEDLDGPRIRAGSKQKTLETLDWIGLDWDGSPEVQSDDLSGYHRIMQDLAEAGLVYPCTASRSDIASAASAPQEGDHETSFPTSLRPTEAGQPCRFDPKEGVHWRLLVEAEEETVEDLLKGCHRFNLARECGDFVVWTVRNEPSYQLAVVIDDVKQGVTDVIRGDDLLPSAARQQLIYAAIHAPPPRWWHMPLVRGSDGRRLAKRHGDTRLETYRERGTTPEQIIGLLCFWCGLIPERNRLSANQAIDLFDPDVLPGEDIVFTQEDDDWLRA
mgnify:CR=1 FL=1